MVRRARDADVRRHNAVANRCAASNQFLLRQGAGGTEHPGDLLVVSVIRGESSAIRQIHCPVALLSARSRLSSFEQIRKRLLLAKRQDAHQPAWSPALRHGALAAWGAGVRTSRVYTPGPRSKGKALERVVIILQGQPNLF